MKIRIFSPNLAKVQGGLKALIAGIPITMKTSAKKIAQQVLDNSLTKSPSCPEDTGALRASGRVETVKEGYAVVYGGKGVDYAAYVHDDMRPRRYTRPGSGPKFVETHMLRQSEEAPPKLQKVLSELADKIMRVYRK
jgi:hypothetical protein